jgi:hypothetical protein
VAAASLTTPVFDLKVKGKGTRYKSRPVPCDTLGQEWTDCVESKERSGESVGVMGLSSEGVCQTSVVTAITVPRGVPGGMTASCTIRARGNDWKKMQTEGCGRGRERGR